MIKLMEAGGSNNDILGEDAWVFSCKCGKFTSSDEPSFIVEVHAFYYIDSRFSKNAHDRNNGLSVHRAIFGPMCDVCIQK